MAEPEFVYVHSVEGHLVHRFGTDVAIGATRTRLPDGSPGPYAWDEGEVVALPAAHWGRYLKEYNRLVAGGALVVVEKKDHDACMSRQAEASRREGEALKAAAQADAASREAPAPVTGPGDAAAQAEVDAEQLDNAPAKSKRSK